MSDGAGGMGVRAAAEYLGSRGYPCGVGTVRALVKAGRLRCRRPGVTRKGRMVFMPELLDAFLAAEVVGGVSPAGSTPAGPRKAPRPRPAKPPAAAAAPAADRKARADQAWGD